MDKVSKADIFLVEQIRAGKDEAWSQLIDRYQGRLLTFARARLPQHADGEDIVQETFIAFLKGVHSFRHECNLETFLFAMLRRKIIDNYRRCSARNFCLIQDVYDSSPEERGSDAMDGFVAPDPSVSWYVRKDEQADIQRQALAEALTALVSHYKKSLSFLELKIVESIFYSHLTNSDTAKLLGLSANRIGVFDRHRNAVQRTELVAPHDRRFGVAGGVHRLLVHAGDEDAEFRVEFVCPANMSFGQLDRRNFFRTDHFPKLVNRRKAEFPVRCHGALFSWSS